MVIWLIEIFSILQKGTLSLIALIHFFQDYIIPRLTQLGDLKQMDLDNASVSDLGLETQSTDCENLWTYSTRKFVEKNTKV